LLVIPLVFFFLISNSTTSFAQESMGSIELTIRYSTGDRLDLYQTTVKVYQDLDEEPFVTAGFPESNPFLIDPLPTGHKYKVEIYVNGMLGETTKIDVNGDEELEMFVPSAGGYVFVVYYDDKTTPIKDTKIAVRSNDGFEWGRDITDNDGKTKRFWLQSNNLIQDYYEVEITIDETVVFTFKDTVKFFPNVQEDIRIVTDWPKIVDDLITVSVYNGTKKVSKYDGSFVVEIYDSADNKVSQSTVNTRGDAFFSNLKVGHYLFRALKIPDVVDSPD